MEILPSYTICQHFKKIIEIVGLYGELYPHAFKNNPLRIRTLLLEIKKCSSVLKDDATLIEIDILKLLTYINLNEVEEFPVTFILEACLKINDRSLVAFSTEILKQFLSRFGLHEELSWEVNIWLKNLKCLQYHHKMITFLEKVIELIFYKSSYFENIITDSMKEALHSNTQSGTSNNNNKFDYTEMRLFSVLVPAALESVGNFSFENIN
ncbi:uncharacterized protein LOC111613153, partial [Centruroides sculpturatus]|uniref:uncharacterized protein LOC111613153 n=1 Tax=Centruroides sculpturatus TaxID=218467 RepID=UPI000C6E9011